MKLRLSIVYLSMTLIFFMGVNAFAGTARNVGSLIPHFENSHSHSARYHGNHSQYLEDNSMENELDLDLAAELTPFSFTPSTGYVEAAPTQWLPRGPTVTEKRFLVLCSILV